MKKSTSRNVILCLGVAVFLAVVLFLVIQPLEVEERDRQLLGGLDVWLHTGPYGYYMDYSIHQGALPLWNPLVFCGMPFAANPLTMTFYPPNLLRSVATFSPTPMKTHIGLAVLMALHYLLAGCATFFWARRYSLSAGASLVAAIGFAFSASFVLRSTVHIWLDFMAAWTPVILLFQHKAMCATSLRPRLAFALCAALALGFALLIGFAQIAIYIGALTGAYWLLHRATRLPETGDRSLRAWARLLASDTFMMTLIYGVAVLVAFSVLLPASELTPFTGRAKGVNIEIPPPPVTLDYTPWKLLKLFSLYAGLGEPRDILASGSIVLMLALASLSSRRVGEVIVFLGLTYVMVDVCIGSPLPVSWLIERFSPFEFTKVPRGAVLLCLPLSMMAAFGVDAVKEQLENRRESILRFLYLSAIGLAIPTLVYVQTNAEVYYLGKRGFDLAPAIVTIPAAAALLMLLAAWLPARSLFALAFAGMVAAEIVFWNGSFMPYLMREKTLYPNSIEALNSSAEIPLENRRGAQKLANTSMYQLKPMITGYDSVHLRAVSHVLRRKEVEGIYDRQLTTNTVTHNPRGNLLFKRMFWLSRNYVDGPLPPKHEFFPSATTAFLENADQIPVARIERTSLEKQSVSKEGSTIQELDARKLQSKLRYIMGSSRRGPHVLVRFPKMTKPPEHSVLRLILKSDVTSLVSVGIGEWLPGGIKGDRSSLLAIHLEKDIPQGQIFELPLPDYSRFDIIMTVNGTDLSPPFEILGAQIVSDALDEGDLIRIVSWKPNSIEVEVTDLPGHRILTYLDADYPGWNAYIDDEPTPILRSAEAFKAVVVPPGTHRVRFEFKPTSVYAGMAVSSITFIACIFAIMLLLRSQRGHERSNQEENAAE